MVKADIACHGMLGEETAPAEMPWRPGHEAALDGEGTAAGLMRRAGTDLEERLQMLVRWAELVKEQMHTLRTKGHSQTMNKDTSLAEMVQRAAI